MVGFMMSIHYSYVWLCKSPFGADVEVTLVKHFYSYNHHKQTTSRLIVANYGTYKPV